MSLRKSIQNIWSLGTFSFQFSVKTCPGFSFQQAFDSFHQISSYVRFCYVIALFDGVYFGTVWWRTFISILYPQKCLLIGMSTWTVIAFAFALSFLYFMFSSHTLHTKTHAFRHMRTIEAKRWTGRKEFKDNKRVEICKINKRKIKKEVKKL